MPDPKQPINPTIQSMFWDSVESLVKTAVPSSKMYRMLVQNGWTKKKGKPRGRPFGSGDANPKTKKDE